MPSAQFLIVEGERLIAAELSRPLTRPGCAVVAIAGPGAEALGRARALAPDLVLMAIGWPGGMNGIEAAAHIWEDLQIPVGCDGVRRSDAPGPGEDPMAPARDPQAF